MTLILVYTAFSYVVLSQFVAVNVVHTDLQVRFSAFAKLIFCFARNRLVHILELFFYLTLASDNQENEELAN